MKTVTKWMGYEEARQRAETPKGKKDNKQGKSKKPTKGYVTCCGGIQPLPILRPIEKEE